MPTTINDELTRIEGAKADIATAIGGKGVTVPANAKIDDFADLIDTIQTGGGSPNLQSKSVSITTNGTTNVVADSGYDGLSSVEVGVSVETYYSFIKNLCEDNLTNVVFPAGISGIPSYFLRGVDSIETLTIPDSVTAIGSYCCYQAAGQNKNITTFNGGSGLQEIGSYCFYSCTKLVNVNLKSLIYLRSYSFMNCSILAAIVLPNNISRIEGYAFQNTALSKLIIKATTPPTLTGASWSANTPIASGTGYIYVPNNNVNDYKSANIWSNYSAQIKGWVYDSQNRIVDANNANNILVNADGTIYVEP